MMATPRPAHLVELPVKRDGQRHRGRAKQEVHELRALKILRMACAACQQHAHHHDHRQQHRVQERVLARLLIHPRTGLERHQRQRQVQ
jgi:hypothetical protein